MKNLKKRIVLEGVVKSLHNTILIAFYKKNLDLN